MGQPDPVAVHVRQHKEGKFLPGRREMKVASTTFDRLVALRIEPSLLG